MTNLQLTHAQIYNTDETALCWRRFIEHSLLHQNEKLAPGRKIFKDRVTFLPCFNIDGTKNLPFLLLGKGKNKIFQEK